MAATKRRENWFLLFLMLLVFAALVFVGYKIWTLQEEAKKNTTSPASAGEPSPRESGVLDPNNFRSSMGAAPMNGARIYFPNRQQTGLFFEPRQIPGNRTLLEQVRLITNELLLGPQTLNEADPRLFGENVSLRACFFKDEILYLDFNRFLFRGEGLPIEELLLKTYAIVNSVTQLKQGIGVMFLIEGEAMVSQGEINFDLPLYFKEDLILASGPR